MKNKFILGAIAFLLLPAVAAQADAIIDNGTIQMGINDEGHLNVGGGAPSSGTGTTSVGLRFLPTGAEATAPGCLCEGWGAGSGSGTVFSGYANVSVDGVVNLSLVSFASTASTATSVVDISDGSGGVLRVTHHYSPAPETANLYRVDVTIENVVGGVGDITDLVYRRVMDWDVEPTAFDEFVTIGGTALATAVTFASDDGFATANPNGADSSILFTGDAVDSGPEDHGALFDFNFGALADGASFSFVTFYGAAATEAGAFAALAAVGAEVFSFGQPDGGATSGAPNTFIFAFKGVGGVVISAVPLPAGGLLGLLGLGFVGATGAIRRRLRK